MVLYVKLLRIKNRTTIDNIDDLYYFIYTAMTIFFNDFSEINNKNHGVVNNHTDFGIILDWKFKNDQNGYRLLALNLFLYVDNYYTYAT